MLMPYIDMHDEDKADVIIFHTRKIGTYSHSRNKNFINKSKKCD